MICVDSIFESICFFCKIALSIIFIVVAYINFNNWIMFSIGDFGWLSITAFNNLNFLLLLCYFVLFILFGKRIFIGLPKLDLGGC